jgi:hypothetical protein
MTCGIYKLIFAGTDYVYIGQSVDIESRFKQHIESLIYGHGNYKLLAAYVLFKTPKLIIIEECDKESLMSKEEYYIHLYDSINNGLNVQNPKNSPKINKGYITHNCKYTEEKYFELLKYLIENYELSNRQIAINIGVDTATVNQLRSLKSYHWLKIRYSELYSELEELYKLYKSNYTLKKENVAPKLEKIYPTIVCPKGNEYNINYGEVSRFAKDHNINYTGLNKVLNYKLKHISGWRLKNYT